MTEQEWLTCKNPKKIIESFARVLLETKLDPRLRRFAVECCRRVRHLITEDVFLAAADAAEAYVWDSRKELTTFNAMETALNKAGRHFQGYARSANRSQYHAALAAIATCASTDWLAGGDTMREAAQALNQSDPESCDLAELQYQAVLLRDILGPQCFRTIFFDPAWLTWHDGLLISMAQKMYDSRDFTDMPILADAIEEAGCSDQDILVHCRSRGEHVRGCWVVDNLLGKS